MTHDELEKRVQERTAALAQANASLQAEITERKQVEQKLRNITVELDRFNRLMIDREERMIELKRQINELSRALGRPAPYDLSFAESETEGHGL